MVSTQLIQLMLSLDFLNQRSLFVEVAVAPQMAEEKIQGCPSHPPGKISIMQGPRKDPMLAIRLPLAPLLALYLFAGASFAQQTSGHDWPHIRGPEGTVDNIADAVMFLASDEASFITGDALVVDGGGVAG